MRIQRPDCGAPSGGGKLLGQVQREGEAGTLPVFAGDGHLLAEVTHDLVGDGQTEPGALAVVRFVGLVQSCDGFDFSFVKSLTAQVRRYSLYADVEAVAGVELRHVPPALIPSAAQQARDEGAALVLVYGETLSDQVAEGTNFAAIDAGADILVHPGLIDEKAAAYAAEKGVALEFTSCPRYALANAHTASMALRFGCPLVRGSAATKAEEMTTRAFWPFVIRGCDVFESEEGKGNLAEHLRKSEENLIRKLMGR